MPGSAPESNRPVMAREPLCPSARADAPHAVLIGVVGGNPDEPYVRQLEHPVPVTDALLEATAPLEPTRVLRIAAICIGESCRHFSDGQCDFAAKVATMLPEVTDSLPACGIRHRCRWFAQEGAAACRRCPQVVTLDPHPSMVMAAAMDPRTPVPRTASRPDLPATGIRASPELEERR
jgi:hypothetical protein